MRGWFIEQGNELYYHMLQAEKVKEAVFFSNSHITMDLEALKETLEQELGDIKVGLRYKTVFRGKQALRGTGKTNTVRGIHIELNKL